ncbi:hypothetical protein OG874_32905 [Nocardia sp. NBC_00565]|uniref:hypothetical protein n=1 Tax=Nocardia sp. NBC_00565 TaxID=2975993 RepID=UPI002E805F62|nr:hypothetical protein [Nocardia sp. NBC_00565]WUC01557.1 hypothetical protein OG874_32905 [Nocardia sp. NBC_00565]
MTGTAFSVAPHTNRPPRAVSVAFIGLVVALLCGVGEAITYTAVQLDRPNADIGSLATGLAIRGTIYLVVLAVACQMARGARWARIVLTFGIGVIGLASLIIEPLAATLSAREFSDLFDDLTPSAVITGAFRTAHILAVLVAIPAMYRPSARRYFRSHRA